MWQTIFLSIILYMRKKFISLRDFIPLKSTHVIEKTKTIFIHSESFTDYESFFFLTKPSDCKPL